MLLMSPACGGRSEDAEKNWGLIAGQGAVGDRPSTAGASSRRAGNANGEGVATSGSPGNVPAESLASGGASNPFLPGAGGAGGGWGPAILTQAGDGLTQAGGGRSTTRNQPRTDGGSNSVLTGGKPSASGGTEAFSGGQSAGSSGGTYTRGGAAPSATGGSSATRGGAAPSATGGTTQAVTAVAALAGAAMIGAPTIDPSGYVTVAAGKLVMVGFISSSTAGSGSTIGLTYGDNNFCASGTVAANSAYKSWAVAGFNVNQAASGASGSSSSIELAGSAISVTYLNKGDSPLEFQVYDGGNYWCCYLPTAKDPTTALIPFTALNTACWDGSGTAFVSGTSIKSVQLVVGGSASSKTPFEFCFLGLTVI